MKVSQKWNTYIQNELRHRTTVRQPHNFLTKIKPFNNEMPPRMSLNIA